MKGLFGSMFDFNDDGEMDILETAAETAFLHELMAEEDKEIMRGSNYDSDDEDEFMTELELSGLDVDELEYMDADERREALEYAGLDPDDYDF